MDCRPASIELGGGHPEAEVIVTVVRLPIVAIRHAAVLRFVVPGAAAIHAVRAFTAFALFF